MARFEVKVKHRLTVSDAIDRLQTVLQKLQRGGVSQLNSFSYLWSGYLCNFTFTALGGRGSGQLTISDSEVVAAGELNGFALSLARGELENQLRTQLEEVLAGAGSDRRA